VGYLPAEVAPAWAWYANALAARGLAARGLAPRVSVEVGASAEHWNPRTRKHDLTIWNLTVFASPESNDAIPDDAGARP
jgi:hypothetical protein